MTPIALIGDSHAEVLFPLLRPALEAQGYTVALQEAKRGWSEASYLRDAGFPVRLRAARPTVALVHLGGNNAQTGAAYEATLRQFLGTLRAAGVERVYWVGPYIATSNTADAARRHAQTAEEQARLLPALSSDPAVSWLDTRPFSATGHSDGIHFTRTAYADFARRISAWISAPSLPVALPGGRWGYAAAGAAVLLTLALWIRHRRVA